MTMFQDDYYALRFGRPLSLGYLLATVRASIAGNPDDTLVEEIARLFVTYVNNHHLDPTLTWVPHFACVIGPEERAGDPALQNVEHLIDTAFHEFCRLMPGSAA